MVQTHGVLSCQTLLGCVIIILTVLRMSVCVSTTFTDVGSKVLVSYYNHTWGPEFLCWRLFKGGKAEALRTRRERWPNVLRAYKTPVSLSGPKGNTVPCPPGNAKAA